MYCLRTGDSVERRDHQHENGGQVEVPSQTHLDEQGSRVEVSLVQGMNKRQRLCIANWVIRCLRVRHTDIFVKIDRSSERTAR